MPLILEGILTTLNEDGSPRISPMGPIVDASLETMRLRPFLTSHSYHNLARTRCGVFHVTDDVELLARAALHQLAAVPRLTRRAAVDGVILADACRWYALAVEAIDDGSLRAEVACRVVQQGRLRDFLGFNRAKHAVLEAAILATRIDRLPPHAVLAEYRRLRQIVAKTAGAQEMRAFAFLENYVRQTLGP